MGERFEDIKIVITMANKHMKRCSILAIIKKMPIKITIRHHATLMRMAKIIKTDYTKCW